MMVAVNRQKDLCLYNIVALEYNEWGRLTPVKGYKYKDKEFLLAVCWKFFQVCSTMLL